MVIYYANNMPPLSTCLSISIMCTLYTDSRILEIITYCICIYYVVSKRYNIII